MENYKNLVVSDLSTKSTFTTDDYKLVIDNLKYNESLSFENVKFLLSILTERYVINSFRKISIRSILDRYSEFRTLISLGYKYDFLYKAIRNNYLGELRYCSCGHNINPLSNKDECLCIKCKIHNNIELSKLDEYELKKVISCDKLTLTEFVDLFSKVPSSWLIGGTFSTPTIQEIIERIDDVTESYKRGLNYIDVLTLIKSGSTELVLPKCPICGAEIHSRGSAGFAKTCSKSCGYFNSTDKRSLTMNNRYGAEFPFQSKIIQDKMRSDSYTNTGYYHHWSNPEVIEERRKTWLDIYGVDNPALSSEVHEKIKSTNIDRYGSEYPFQSDIIQEKIRINKLDESYLNLFKFDNFEPAFTRDEWLGHGCYKEYKWKCKKCGKIFINSINGWMLPRCIDCFPYLCNKDGKSYFQEQVTEYIVNELKLDVIECDRSIIRPKELDIVIPSKKVAIEINGDYWHSDVFKDENYHLDKTESCENAGYQLIHIFEHEWYEHSSLIKNRLKNALGLSQKYYARNCTIKEVDSSESNKFLDTHHTQGHVNSSVRLGLYIQDKLVALMTFGVPRFNSNYEWELIRYCSEGRVIGGASKLLKYFEKTYTPKSMISYADRRWSSSGNLYSKLGFNLIATSMPNYFYVNLQSKLRYSRYQCMKFKLPDILGDKFKPELTEVENMLNAGFTRLFDCGNYVFGKNYLK